MKNTEVIDMNGKTLEIGHICAVRYCWNSYIGIVTMRGLYVGNRFHLLEPDKTYQIIGHENKSHADFNQDVLTWTNKYLKGLKRDECPVKITVYDNLPKENACD